MNTTAFCGSCGSALTANLRFCQACGAPAPGLGPTYPPAPPQPTAVTLGPSANPYACPRCKEVDIARKVSAVVNDATTLGTIGGSVVTGGYNFGRHGGPTVSAGMLSATTASQTAIGRALSPPNRPRLRSAWTAGRVIGLIFLIIVILAGLASGGAGGILLALVFLGLAIWVIADASQKGRIYQQMYEREVAAWDAAMQKWDRLYCCLRCEGIYYPGQPELYRIVEMMPVIYS